VTSALAAAYVAGAKLDWAKLYPGAMRVPLPTYPFQRERFWASARADFADAGSIGLRVFDHPLLSAAIDDPDGERLTLSGHISLATHPWLADHAVQDSVLLPGTAFADMAVKAGEEVGCEVVQELTLQTPLVVPETAAVSLRVSVGAEIALKDGKRPITIHSRVEGAEEWTLHATGVLAVEVAAVPEPFASWPPAGAEPLACDDLYERLADIGFSYGPAFQGVSAIWHKGDEVYAEVSLDDEQRQEAGRFAVHPALLDSAFHAVLGVALAEADGDKPTLPFDWRGVRVFAAGASSLRVRISRHENRIELLAADPSGVPVVEIDSILGRPIELGQLGASNQSSLFRIDWKALALDPKPALAKGGLALVGPVEIASLQAERYPDLDALLDGIGGGEAPQRILVDARDWGAGAATIEAAHGVAANGLGIVQALLGEERLAASRLIFFTEGALVAKDAEEPDLSAATFAGVLRSAFMEHPGRFALVDTDADEASIEALSLALATTIEEPQLALRQGEVLAARLAEEEVENEEGGIRALDPEKTVLITGGLGGLGVFFARHLAKHHGARHLLLVSREAHAGFAELKDELTALGAEVEFSVCDVSDRDRLARLIASIPDEHPLDVVIHAAGVLDGGLIADLETAQLDRVLAPKADGAYYLHELTEGLDLSAFIMFSSIASAAGGPGQANYAAANSFLDALAARRRARGLPATSLAWGLWARPTGMISTLGEADVARMGRLGITPISDEQGSELFDAAIQSAPAHALALTLNRSALRSLAASGALPTVFRGLVKGVGSRRKAASGQLAAKLAGQPEAERERIALEAVKAEVAAVLGHESGDVIDPERAFIDLGFDSLAAVELRDRLVSVTAAELAATVVFDYPSPMALALHVLEAVGASAGGSKALVRARASEEPIAIVGMACRYPGGVASPEQLWQLVAEGRDGISEFPTDRGWNLERLYDPDLNAGAERLTSYTREGGFVHGAGEFDAGFFGVAPRVAMETDPQQRLLLEAAWEALEDAGIDPRTLARTQTGVFAGAMYQDYGVAPGMTQSLVSGRVSYALGLEGPAMTIDTACSSSLVAMHLAAQALQSGECSLALAGGVTVLSTPNAFINFSRQRGLAPDGRSKSFADAADGVGWSEGVGVLALQRLSDARRDGHRVLATIKGSAVNQDGASNGITAPNGPSQERVIRQALANARLEPSEVDVVEAHGTGTTLGDPIEAGALLATYGQDRDAPLHLGSIKSNIGHTQAAAGVAGVIKMVEAMHQGVLPKTLHVDAPSSKVDWEAGEVELLTSEVPWEPNGKPRRAGVSSFGISGTNAHVILEEAPEPVATQSAEDGDIKPPLPDSLLLPLSAKSEPALRDIAARLVVRLEEDQELDPADVALSLATTRAHFDQRAVLTGESREELLEGLTALVGGETSPYLVEGKAKSGTIAYLFTGQGAQRPGMGCELYEASPVFAKALDEVFEALDPHLERSLKNLLFAAEGSDEAALLDRTEFTQPVLFALEVALFRLLEATGVKPSFLAGHSIGELAAAHLAGIFSLEDAAKLVAARGRLMGALPGGGAMVAIEASEAEVAEVLEGKEEELSLAAVNSPTSTVISGAEEAALQVKAAFDEKGARTKQLTVSHAFHSPLMEPMLADFEAVAKELDYAEPQIPVLSNLTGEILDAERATDPAYWVDQVRGTVRFADSVATLDRQSVSTFIELGPDGVLTAMAASSLDEALSAALIPTLRSGRAETAIVATALASAHVAGAKLDWAKLYPAASRVPLPTYPFQRERFWSTVHGNPGDLSAAGQTTADHPLLGAAIEDPGGGWLLTGRISLATHPWLADHTVLDTAIVPGTAFLEMALRAGEQAGTETVEELTLQAPLVLLDESGAQIQVSVGIEEEGRRSISIHSRLESREDEAGEWTLHASGYLSGAAAAAPEPFATWPPEGARTVEISGLYEELAEIGFQYGPAFQGLTALWRDDEGELYAEVSLVEEQGGAAGGFAVHPALFDAAFHAGIGAALRGSGEGGGAPVLPFDWHGVRVFSSGAASLRVRLSLQNDRLRLLAADQRGVPVLEVDSVYGRAVDQGQLAGHARQDSLYRLRWQELSLSETGELETTMIDTREWAQEEEVEASHAFAAKALEAIQAHLADEEATAARLVFLVEGALDAGDAEGLRLPAATLAGLLRSAVSEHPGRFALIDTDGSEASSQALPGALAATTQEPQLVLREGAALVPRLAAAEEPEDLQAPALDPDRTVLVTGGLSGLGALLARHLVEAHGARHLLLVSRSGLEAKGAAELRAELETMGATIEIAACDVSEKVQLEDLFASVPAEHPLGAILHAAGVLDNALLTDLDAQRLDRVLAPKADAAWYLHELSAGLELSHFVLFSSAAGLLGGPGQGNYAAANSFLDALAAKRRAQGLAGASLAWGLWGQQSTLTGEIEEAQIEQILRQTRMLLGFSPIAVERGLELFDAAVALGDSLLAPVEFDRAALRAKAGNGSLPALMRGLVRVRSASRRQKGWLLSRLQSLSGEERGQALEEAIRAQAGSALGMASADDVGPDSTFPELGFDSLASLEMRDWLNTATRLNLPASVLFDYPNPRALAGFVELQLGPMAGGGEPQAAESADMGKGTLERESSESVSIGSLYERAEMLGRSDQGATLLSITAGLRPTFGIDGYQDHLPKQSRLATGPAGPKLICIPTLLALSGPHQYVKFAQRLEGKRTVAALSIPGYLEGELLPEDLEVALVTQAAAIQRCAGDDPYVLLGHSTGGLFAHFVAERLSSIGTPPAGLIKVDTYSRAGLADITPYALAGMKQRAGSHFELTDHRLTAMVAYVGLLEDREPEDTGSATLLIRATEPMPGMDEQGARRAQWDGVQTILELPGDHFTIMEEHVAHVAQAVDKWLRDVA
jgi:acyl transferase domain-containing protein/thioesterase domain-containing protein/acyl carrier protein